MPIPEQPLPTDQTEELHKRFAQTREFKLWLQLVEAIKALSDSTAERVDLPTGFLRIATADLENNPFSFPIMRQPWNRIIDELGLPPDLKKPIPASHWTGNGIPGDVPWTAGARGRSGVWGSSPRSLAPGSAPPQ